MGNKSKKSGSENPVYYYEENGIGLTKEEFDQIVDVFRTLLECSNDLERSKKEQRQEKDDVPDSG